MHVLLILSLLQLTTSHLPSFSSRLPAAATPIITRCPPISLLAAKSQPPKKGVKKIDVKKIKRLKTTKPPADVAKDKHLFFDEAEITCRSGGGGHGALISLPKRGDGPKLRRTADDDFELPPGGGAGGDVVLFVDPSCGDLLHLRGRDALVATRGGDSLGLRDLPTAREVFRELCDDAQQHNDAPGSLSAVRLRDGAPLRVPVPPGTFVRTKSGRVLGDLVAPGEELIVASGGEGGPCILREERRATQKPSSKGGNKREQVDLFGDDNVGFGSVGDDPFAMREEELHQLTRGTSGEERRLALVMRTVADVGFVGFPNAGKSTLLGALSRANPEIAPFPFTTLMPNLGAMAAEPGSSSTQQQQPPKEWTPEAESAARRGRVPPTVLADLPGLVEGAHAGKGLGRLFLRHLRRVRVVLYVLDTSPSSKISVSEQYEALRRELELYNPQYLERPHIVALNKLDVPLAEGGDEALATARKAATKAVAQSASKATEQTAPPVAIVPISGLKGKGLRILKEAIESALAASREAEAAA